MSNPTTPGVLSPERLLAEARDEALDAVMYLAARLGSLHTYWTPATPAIEWIAKDADWDSGVREVANLLPLLRERDAIGRARYGVPLMVAPVTREVTRDELTDAEHLYRTAVTLAAMFVEGA